MTGISHMTAYMLLTAETASPQLWDAPSARTLICGCLQLFPTRTPQPRRVHASQDVFVTEWFEALVIWLNTVHAQSHVCRFLCFPPSQYVITPFSKLNCVFPHPSHVYLSVSHGIPYYYSYNVEDMPSVPLQCIFNQPIRLAVVNKHCGIFLFTCNHVHCSCINKTRQQKERHHFLLLRLVAVLSATFTAV